PSSPTLYVLHQLFIHYIIAEHIGEADNRLLYRANPLHDFSALAHELAQLLVRRPYNFLNVLITALGSTLDYVATTPPVIHTILQSQLCRRAAYVLADPPLTHTLP